MKEIINSIYDLKKRKASKEGIQEVEVTYPHPKELIDDLVDEFDNREFIQFHGTEDFKNFLTYLLDSRKHRERLKTPEIDNRSINCNCGSIWKIYIKPASVEYPNYFDDNPFGNQPRRERALRFICPMCSYHSMIRNAILIYKIESERVPKSLFRGDNFI